eukprot:TRINITY_DN74578_c0_g1_i1.p1 TRINITY_DN74578_c0_g1~~TRINITY_DN74578_c0_g1_i1.p1  ORF type:complete len:315 (+),score=40.80 TRINITY_DN74578_c0_g1_i1:80-1024(+)
MAPTLANVDDQPEPTIVIEPKSKATALVVIFHGCGGSCYCFEDLATFWSQMMPHAMFVLPSAPMRAHNCRNWMSKEKATGKLLRVNTPWLQALELIEEARRQHGIPFSRIVLMGYSAGAKMASWVALNMPCAIGGLVLLSGGVPNEALPPPRMAEGISRTPVLYMCGSEDRQVLPELCRGGAADLRAKGFAVDFREFPGVVHEIVDEEIDIIGQFLGEILSSKSFSAQPDEKAGLCLQSDMKHIARAVAMGQTRPVVPPARRVPSPGGYATPTKAGISGAGDRSGRSLRPPRWVDVQQPQQQRARSQCAVSRRR